VKRGVVVDLIGLNTGLSVKRLTFLGVVRNTPPDVRNLFVANGNSTIDVVRLAPPQLWDRSTRPIGKKSVISL
jgi:hypothetical protein